MTSDSASDEEQLVLPSDADDYVDIATFEQILEMDDDEEKEFSRGLVYGFFDQASTTFKEMDEALSKNDHATLSSLGHFLKGSSATLGLYKIKDSCEKIQHWGELKDATGAEQQDKTTCLKNIRDIMPIMRADYEAAKTWLKKFYEDGDEEDEDE